MSYKYYELIRELAVTDFKLKYQGSVLGYLWSFAKPLMLFAVLYVVFTKFIPLGKDVPNYPLYLLLGIVLWTYFADSTSTAMSSIVDRSDLIRKVYFPRIVIVIAASISSLITLCLNLLVILVFMVISGVSFQLSGLAFIFLVAELYVLSLGFALFLSAAYVKFRDFRHIWEVGLQVLFYASAIIFPLTLVPSKIVPFLLLNPITQIVQDARHLIVTSVAIIPADSLDLPFLLIPYLIPPIALVIGYYVFKISSPNFAEDL